MGRTYSCFNSLVSSVAWFTCVSKILAFSISATSSFSTKIPPTNDDFKGLVNNIADALLNSNATTVEEALNISVDGKTINDMIVDKTATIGEKLSLRRFQMQRN